MEGWRGFQAFEKAAYNPILIPQGDGWQSVAVCNPAAWSDGQQVTLLYRAMGPGVSPLEIPVSSIGLAVSEDGFHFERSPRPVLATSEPYEQGGGCEDPRLARIGGTFYLTYTAFDGSVARLCLATSLDLQTWIKNGPVFSDDQWLEYFPKAAFPETSPGWSKSGAILAEPVNGVYWMYFGDTAIWAAHSKDLKNWEIVPEPVIMPRPGYFDSRLVEPGPPPVLTSAGIWLGYNAADTNLHYSFAQVWLDRDQPTRVLRRWSEPLLVPTSEDEVTGLVNQVVFGTGLVSFHGQSLLYYGMADSRVGVAVGRPGI